MKTTAKMANVTRVMFYLMRFFIHEKTQYNRSKRYVGYLIKMASASHPVMGPGMDMTNINLKLS